MFLPSVDQIVSLHDHVIAMTGGASGLRSEDVLASSVARVSLHFDYAPDGDAIDAAALLASGLVKAHAFVDGNKRAAYGAMKMVLSASGLSLTCTTDSVVNAIALRASGEISEEEFTSWLRDNTKLDEVFAALFAFDLEGPENG